MSEAPILVVDDDPTILATVSEALDFEGFRVMTATNGAEALELVDRNWPSLVLLDMRMPVLDGWGFMRAVRERGLNLTVVVMTAAAEPMVLFMIIPLRKASRYTPMQRARTLNPRKKSAPYRRSGSLAAGAPWLATLASFGH